jgi:hypothetical protein
MKVGSPYEQRKRCDCGWLVWILTQLPTLEERAGCQAAINQAQAINVATMSENYVCLVRFSLAKTTR